MSHGRHRKVVNHHVTRNTMALTTVAFVLPTGLAATLTNNTTSVEPRTHDTTTDSLDIRLVSYSHTYLSIALVNQVRDDVVQVQSTLRAPVNNIDTGPIDGQYGPLTSHAVTVFQQRHGLEVDGVVGPQTWWTLGLGDWGGATAQSQAAPASTQTSRGSAIVAEAHKYLGVPYVWGGKTPSGFDCSGFVSYVMSRVLPQYGTPDPGYMMTTGWLGWGGAHNISASEVQPGDIVVSPSHMGIAVGNNQMIHESGSRDQVVVADIYDSNWTYRRIN